MCSALGRGVEGVRRACARAWANACRARHEAKWRCANEKSLMLLINTKLSNRDTTTGGKRQETNGNILGERVCAQAQVSTAWAGAGWRRRGDTRRANGGSEGTCPLAAPWPWAAAWAGGAAGRGKVLYRECRIQDVTSGDLGAARRPGRGGRRRQGRVLRADPEAALWRSASVPCCRS